MKIIDKIDEKFRNLKTNFPEWLVVHHAKAPASQSFETIKNYHVRYRKFDTIGYQYLIVKNGDIYRGRPDLMHGAHTKEQNINKKSLGICLTGDFDVFLPTKEQVDSLRGLLEVKRKQYYIPLDRIVPHRFFLGKPPYKSCYGANLSDDWASNLVKINGKIEEAANIPITTSMVEKLYTLLKKIGLIK